jgi:hypothetical protein
MSCNTSDNDRQDFQFLSLATSCIEHHSPIIFSRSQFVDTENITRRNQRKNGHVIDNTKYRSN